MRRRRFLGWAGASTVGLSGCLGAGSGTADDEEAISVTTDEPPSEPNVGFGVTVEQRATTEQPARLRITIHNRKGSDGVEKAQTIRAGPEPPISSHVGTGPDGAKLVLEPIYAEGMDSAGTHGGGRCWYATEGLVSLLTDVDTDERQNVTLDAGGGVFLTYYLLGHHENDPCIPAGTYRFESAEYGARDGPSDVEWGFDLTIDSSVSRSATPVGTRE